MELFKLFGTIAIKNSDANDALESTSAKGESAQGRLESAFKKICAAVATYLSVKAITNFGKTLVTLAADAETTAAKVNTLLSTGTDTEAYFEEMMDASTKTGVAMTEFAEAVYSAISASVDQADAVAFTTEAVKLAKAGFTSTTTAVDVLTTAINAYGLSAEDAAHLSDVLITTQNLGKTTVDELASSMGKVIPLASAYGVNIENLSAAYAELTKGGIATAEATTYLKSMFTELADEGSTVSDILKNQTGLSFSKLMASGMSLGDVMDILMASVEGDATAFANLWSSTEAGTGALALANAGAEEFNETLNQMENSAGATNTAYETVSNTFNEKTEKMKVAAQNLGIAVAQEVLPSLTGMVEKLTEVFQNASEKAAPAIEQLGATIYSATQWCSEHTTVLGLLAAAVGIVAVAVTAYNAVQAVKAAMNAAEATSLGALIAAKMADAAATLAALAPYILIVAAIAAVIAIVVLLVKHWDEIKEKAAEVASAIAEKWEEVKTAMAEKIASIVSDVTSKFNEIKTTISTKLNSAKATVENIFTSIKNGITEKIQAARDAVETAIEKIKGFMNFEFKLPHLPLPHFSVSPPGWSIGDLVKGSIPSLGIEWYAKGGILNEPTIFGMNGNKAMVGGEAGAEAVAPIDTLQGYIAEAVASQNAGLINALDRILDAIVSMDDNMGGNLRDALEGTSLSVNKREFGRLVRGVI